MNDINEIIIVLFVFGLLIGSSIAFEFYLINNKYVYENATVVDKYIKRYDKTDKFFVVIKTKENKTIVLEDRDSLLIFKFNSADIYNELIVGKKYDIYTYGLRIPFLSWFENIEKIEQKENNK